jgi:hypothetical protein
VSILECDWLKIRYGKLIVTTDLRRRCSDTDQPYSILDVPCAVQPFGTKLRRSLKQILKMVRRTLRLSAYAIDDSAMLAHHTVSSLCIRNSHAKVGYHCRTTQGYKPNSKVPLFPPQNLPAQRAKGVQASPCQNTTL